MRIWSSSERARAAAAGEAMPDGRLPIVDLPSLVAAFQSIGRIEDQFSAMSHVMRRAAQLEASIPLVAALTRTYEVDQYLDQVYGRVAVGVLIRKDWVMGRVSALTASGIVMYDHLGQRHEFADDDVRVIQW